MNVRRQRDDWLIAKVSGALVIWDGHDPVLGQIAGELQQRIPTEL